MDTKKPEELIAKFIYELETEERLVRVGLKETSQTAAIYKKYRGLFTKETLAQVSGELKRAKDTGKKDILERLYYTLASATIGQKLAKARDELTTYFSKATVKVGTETLAYFELGPRIAKEPQFFRREQYDDAASGVVARAVACQEKLLAAQIRLTRDLGFLGYLDYWARAKKMDYGKFYRIAGSLIAQTDKLWRVMANRTAGEILGKPFVKTRSCHMSYLRSLSSYDNFYGEKLVVGTFEKWAGDVGLASFLTIIKIDDAARPKKNPRAVCYWPDPPQEVHLVIKPIGGEQDFEAMFHEGGHALHGAAIDRNLPFAYRLLARSNALTETYAFLLEDLVFEPDFLTPYLNVSAFTGNKIRAGAYFVNLMLLRRYLGKFIYEYEMFADKGLTVGPSLYAKTLEKTTGFVHNKINWLADMDNGFYSAEYLRAWIAAAQIKDYLRRKFGKKWFVNKRAGEFFRKLWNRGVQDEIEDVVKRLGYKPWDISFLVKGYREVLK